MTRQKTRIAKVDELLYRETQKIAADRLAKGLDARYSPQRVQRKILNHPSWPIIKSDLSIAKFLDDERGQFLNFSIFNIFSFIIISFAALVIFGGMVWMMGLLSTTFHNIGLANEGNSGMPGYANLTAAADNTFGKVNESIQGLRMVAIALIVSLALSLIFTNALVKVHPAFFFVYILIVILAIIFSAPIANSYESLLQANIYDGTLLSFTGSNWLILNLPLITAIVGVLGGIFLFINIVTPGNQGGLV